MQLDLRTPGGLKAWRQCLLLVIATCTVPGLSWAQQAKVLTGCADQSPPFVVMRDHIGIAGFSFDLFQAVARQLGRKAEVRELPWARCLAEVKAGGVDVVIDAYEDQSRHQFFHYTKPYYTLTPQIFYRTSGAQGKFPVATVTQLRPLQGCGLREYTYEHYDLDAKALDLGTTSDRKMMEKLLGGRCDYAIEELEYIIGGRNYDPDWLDETGTSSFRPAWARGPQVHFLISNARADGLELKQKMNAAIEASTKSGLIKQLQKQYFQTTAKQLTK